MGRSKVLLPHPDECHTDVNDAMLIQAREALAAAGKVQATAVAAAAAAMAGTESSAGGQPSGNNAMGVPVILEPSLETAAAQVKAAEERVASLRVAIA